MAKTKEQKKEILENLADKIKRAKSIIFTRFDGLGVKDNEDLRKQLKKENSEYFVVKKTLLNLAFKDHQIESLDIGNFEGRIATVFNYGDEAMPAKIIDKFKSSHEEKLNFVGGILTGPASARKKLITVQELCELAKLPSRQELYAQIVGSINAPISGLVNSLAGNLRNLVYVFKAVEESKK
jgi:large subunit ribosomal protein L10